MLAIVFLRYSRRPDLHGLRLQGKVRMRAGWEGLVGMLQKSIAVAGTAVTLGVVACGSVGGSDPEFWRPAQGYATALSGTSGGAGGTDLGSGGVLLGGA